MTAAEKVLIVDDDKFVQQLLSASLTEKFETRSAFTGEQGIELADDWHPGIILLDVELPGQNGYEVCDQLKRNPSTEDIPIVFLSTKSSLRERMLGYEVGGEDYLVKPFSSEEIGIKLERISALKQAEKQLKESAESAQKTALEAMSTSYELGKAVRFVERSYGVPDYEGLGRELVEFCRDLSLSSATMIATRRGPIFYSSNGLNVSPLETEILEMLHDKDRFVDFGCRTQVNYPHVSLLIKNMPLEDRARYGRIKDTLPFVLGAADAKAKVLDAEKSLMSQSAELTASVEAVKMTLEAMRESIRNNLTGVTSVMSELLATLYLDLRNMGLDSDQENWICDKVELASKSIFTCIEENSSLEAVLTEVVKLLEKLTKEQTRIITENLANQEFVNDNTDDIELF